jgi:hypothetical protein
MAKVDTTQLKAWKDGDIVTSYDYKKERDMIVTGNNDNADRIATLEGGLNGSAILDVAQLKTDMASVKAKNDSQDQTDVSIQADVANIKTTYVKKAGDSMTGSLSITGSLTTSNPIFEGGTSLVSKYAQLTTNTYTGNQAIDRNTAGASLLNMKNSGDDGGFRFITTTGINHFQSGNYAGNAPKTLQIAGWSSTNIPTLNIFADTTVFKGTIGMMDSGGTAQTILSTKLGDSTGIGIALGGGGLTVIGSGESHTNTLNDPSIGVGTNEQMYITSDYDVNLLSNIQGGFANKHSFIFDKNGKVTVDGYTIGNSLGASPLWTGAVYLNSAQSATPSVALSDCPNGWALIWSDYDAGVGSNDYDWAITFIHKNQPLNQSNLQIIANNGSATTQGYAVKLLTFSNTVITGNVANDSTNAGNNASDICLRRVLMW